MPALFIGNPFDTVLPRLGVRPKPILNRAGFFGRDVVPHDLNREQWARGKRLPWEKEAYRPSGLQRAVFDPGADLRNQDLKNFNLQNADAREVNLTGAQVDGAILGDASSGIALSGATLDGVDFNQATVSGKMTLERASLQGIDMRYKDLAGVQANGADFTRATIPGLTLEGAHLNNATFVSATMPDAKMNHSKIYGTSFRKANLEFAQLQGIQEGGVNNFTGARIKRLKLNASSLPQSQFDGARGDNISATNTVLTNGSFRGLVTNGSNFEHAQLENTKWTGSRVGHTNFGHVSGERATFVKASITDSSFRIGDLRGSDWTGAIVDGTSFEGANFQTAPPGPNQAWAFGKDLPAQKTTMPDLRRASSVKGATATGSDGNAMAIKPFGELKSQQALAAKVDALWQQVLGQDVQAGRRGEGGQLVQLLENARSVYRARLVEKVRRGAPQKMQAEMLRRLEQRIPTKPTMAGSRFLSDLLPYDKLQILQSLSE